ncbi:MAG: 4-hydroxy-tetrahydrodipicolinate reductase [Deltaproteobacteria bacterium RIFOXYA12_FULL_58_15]|nr:MAG: 4-hydroxy-tetrahydrodipicolinate reductase [Deltaproteobacteria bacterium RIFOXYA12_FULL_58_15]OGR09187.1 MAG: 4-hydroxy-tetrahydrodipicolinate reductase [Deltaproteobacteria bacterium RIFOXYB12_FULL_58_9]
MPHKVCVVGAAGRMGRLVLQSLETTAELELSAAIDVVASPGTNITTDLDAAIAASDIVIDFSAPPACTRVAPACVQHNVAWVVATTGLCKTDDDAIAQAAKTVAVLKAANLSVGVNMLLELVEAATSRLNDFDVEIVEIHHRRKRDAPSGTALELSKAAAKHRALQPNIGRAGNIGTRPVEELGISAVRGGDVPGDHTVYFLGDGERLELTHRAGTPAIFAAGAIRAATWLLGRPPGLYSMRDVIR